VAGLLRALLPLAPPLGHGRWHDRHLQHFARRAGTRPRLLALRWIPVARQLARRHRVLAWTLVPGHCQLLPDRPITLTRIAADLNQMLDHFELQPICGLHLEAADLASLLA